MTTRTFAILLFDDVEVLDFCEPFEIFSVANRLTDTPAFNVFTVAEKPGPALNHHAGIVPITMVGVGGKAGPSLKEFLRLS